MKYRNTPSAFYGAPSPDKSVSRHREKKKRLRRDDFSKKPKHANLKVGAPSQRSIAIHLLPFTVRPVQTKAYRAVAKRRSAYAAMTSQKNQNMPT